MEHGTGKHEKQLAHFDLLFLFAFVFVQVMRDIDLQLHHAPFFTHSIFRKLRYRQNFFEFALSFFLISPRYKVRAKPEPYKPSKPAPPLDHEEPHRFSTTPFATTRAAGAGVTTPR